MEYGWIAYIVAAVAIIVLFAVWNSKRYWPGAVGWSIDILTIAFLISINFGDWGALGVAGLIVGTVLGFTGFLTSENSPAT